ncbi:hypothetical protein M758_2G092500 [Ceratodon purpureus]|nr:hypothetical protein M758_2G092500 [Ceratodon purpureus]
MRSRQRCAETLVRVLKSYCWRSIGSVLKICGFSFSSTRWLRSKLYVRRHHIVDVMSSIQSKLD